VPTDAAFKPDNAGLEVERTFTDRDGRAVNLASAAGRPRRREVRVRR